MKKLTILFLGIIFFASCKRAKEEFVGPSICPSSNFKIESSFNHVSTINLASSSMAFTASFNEVVDWTVTIKGQTSKSIKRFSGRSKDINQTWYGEPDTAIFFKAEVCDVILKIACQEERKSNFTITSQSGFTNMPNTLLINNFEGGGAATTWGGYGDEQNDITFNGVVASPSDPSPQGGGYYLLEGDSSAPSYYFGGCFSNNFAMPSGWTDPSQVYMNIFLNSDGLTNSEVQVTLMGGNGVTYRKAIAWTGWKLLSFKLSEIEIQNPTTVTSLDIGLGSSPNKGASSTAKMDFVIFTYGKPFYKETGI
jgi:hypothetical protein